MMVLITYDVNTEDSGGRKRLRQITKQCVNYGQRVQNSVFECLVDAAQCKQLQHKLLAIMDEEKDSFPFAQHAATPLFVRLCRNFVAFAQICREYFGNFAVAPRKGCVD